MKELRTRWVARSVREGQGERPLGLLFRPLRKAPVAEFVRWFNEYKDNDSVLKSRHLVKVAYRDKTHPDYPGHNVVELGLDDGLTLRFIESEVYSA